MVFDEVQCVSNLYEKFFVSFVIQWIGHEVFSLAQNIMGTAVYHASMWPPFPGLTGLVLGPVILAGVWCASYFEKEFERYDLDPKNEKNAFEPFLVKYIRAAEFVIGLATGSIVLLVGSSALHAQGGRLPWFYASPLLLLGWCVIFGVIFIVWLIHNYEEHKHGNPHTRFGYSVSVTLGISALVCFGLGYLFLIILVTR
jgi:hypothetical protein